MSCAIIEAAARHSGEAKRWDMGTRDTHRHDFRLPFGTFTHVFLRERGSFSSPHSTTFKLPASSYLIFIIYIYIYLIFQLSVFVRLAMRFLTTGGMFREKPAGSGRNL